MLISLLYGPTTVQFNALSFVLTTGDDISEMSTFCIAPHGQVHFNI